MPTPPWASLAGPAIRLACTFLAAAAPPEPREPSATEGAVAIGLNLARGAAAAAAPWLADYLPTDMAPVAAGLVAEVGKLYAYIEGHPASAAAAATLAPF